MISLESFRLAGEDEPARSDVGDVGDLMSSFESFSGDDARDPELGLPDLDKSLSGSLLSGLIGVSNWKKANHLTHIITTTTLKFSRSKQKQ